MATSTLFIINGEDVLLDIQNKEILSISDPKQLDIAKYLVQEWSVDNNTTDVIDYMSNPFTLTDPIGTKHSCQFILESRRARDSQLPVYMQSIRGTDKLLEDYEEEGFDIDKAGIIELVSYSLSEGQESDIFEQYNFSYKSLNQTH